MSHQQHLQARGIDFRHARKIDTDVRLTLQRLEKFILDERRFVHGQFAANADDAILFLHFAGHVLFPGLKRRPSARDL